MYKCKNCGKTRFKTVKKTFGVRTIVACRACGQLHGNCWPEEKPKTKRG